jgi:hypothetical protein
VLIEAGLIERHTEAQWRRCELRGEGMRAAAEWIEFYRQFWEFAARPAGRFPQANRTRTCEGKSRARRKP